ncbi:polyprenol phosphomannose-dependent alpha 1,6 mannosyltransferase MptB [Spirosoma arcticum]
MLRILWLILSAIFYLVLAYGVPRQQFGLLIGLLAGLFLGYGWVTRVDGVIDIDRFLFLSAILFRLSLLFAIPQLSDDVYRFVWDGRLMAHGYNPYLYLPSQLLNTPIAAVCGLDESLFRQLNSPNYFTVYPPVNQALFGLASWFSPNSLLGNITWLRLPIILSEIGSLWLMVKLLRRLGVKPNLALLYGLNPLVIIELTGNLHFEAVMIFFSLLAVWLLIQNRLVLSAGALALAIGTKLLPLLLLPLIVHHIGWRKGIWYALLACILTAALFIPFASLELVRNVFSSINLYFQKFEFNASVYYVLRTVGYWIKGYNAIERIGFWLSITTTLSVLWIAFRWRTVPASVQLLATLTLYFAFATTVHAWYITTLIAASVFTRFRYPIVWSALIPLSYFTYHAQPYAENLWLTTAEYGVVAVVMIVEILIYPKHYPTPGRNVGGGVD